MVFVVDHRADTKWMVEGNYRPVRDALKAIEEVMRQEGKDHKKATKPVLEVAWADAGTKRKPGRGGSGKSLPALWLHGWRPAPAGKPSSPLCKLHGTWLERHPNETPTSS